MLRPCACTSRNIRIKHGRLQYFCVARLTVGETAYRNLPRVLGNVFERRVQRALADHEVDDDEGFEDNRPC